MPISAIPNPIYQPAMRIIASITNSFPATVVTTFANQYETGLIVRLIIPNGFGMVQANGLSGSITVIDTVTFTIPIDTTFFDVFSIPGDPLFPANKQQAQVIPIGEDNDLLTLATQNVLTPV